jgi:hypothetical protein
VKCKQIRDLMFTKTNGAVMDPWHISAYDRALPHWSGAGPSRSSCRTRRRCGSCPNPGVPKRGVAPGGRVTKNVYAPKGCLFLNNQELHWNYRNAVVWDEMGMVWGDQQFRMLFQAARKANGRYEMCKPSIRKLADAAGAKGVPVAYGQACCWLSRSHAWCHRETDTGAPRERGPAPVSGGAGTCGGFCGCRPPHLQAGGVQRAAV